MKIASTFFSKFNNFVSVYFCVLLYLHSVDYVFYILKQVPSIIKEVIYQVAKIKVRKEPSTVIIFAS